ncbi:MAG: GNAT family N-acetyltransferase [Alphaproteobacteria bacterium]|nr:GNAT family N-acetyltransferase [Alphaproteobacteria bacterium]
MKIETSRFIMEEIESEDKENNFAQISREIAWKDTVELLLNEKKIDAFVKNIAKKDMALFLAERQKQEAVILLNPLSESQKRITKKQAMFNNAYQNYRRDRFVELSKEKILGYRKQILDICKKLNIDIKTDKKIFEKIKNENLNPPIPITDWHYNIQFLKPDMQDLEQSVESKLWENPVNDYIEQGAQANQDKERNFYFFKITDKETGKIVGISRICSKAKEFIINYDERNKPITEVCVGDPGLFLAPSCQGAGRGSEIYATTLNVLCNFLLKEENKSQNIVIKCNTLNRASRKLQESIGALLINGHRPIDNRCYYMVNEENILSSKCIDKLEKLGVDEYTITTDEKVTYTVSLRKGILQKQENRTSFLDGIYNMLEKVKLSKSRYMSETKTKSSIKIRESKTY